MTATASSISPVNRQELISTILELPEKDFWDLVDTRLNRPKGIRVSRRLLGDGNEYEYGQIIDANDEPSIVNR